MVDWILVPSCPSQSLTSVATIVDWWRFCLAKGRLDPGGEIVSFRQLSRAWFAQQEIMAGQSEECPPLNAGSPDVAEEKITATMSEGNRKPITPVPSLRV